MQNLAGKEISFNNDQLSMELEGAGITAISGKVTTGEVKSNITGLLGGITFERAWYYWCVYCWIPYSVALKIYDDPIGKKDVRIDGHCGCLSPDKCGIMWANKETGKIILQMHEKIQCEGYLGKTGSIVRIAEKILQTHEFADDPKVASNENGFASTYHIDSYEGLKLFSRIVKEANCLSVAGKPKSLYID